MFIRQKKDIYVEASPNGTLCFDEEDEAARGRTRQTYSEAEMMPLKAVVWLVVLTVLTSAVLIVSNLAALKIWELKLPWPESFWPLKVYGWRRIPVDAGIFLFPISYLTGDLLVFIYGEKMANRVAAAVAACALVLAGVLYLLRFLPGYPGADNTAFLLVQSASGRMFCASVVGFLGGQLLNNRYFVRLRSQGGDHYQRWSLKSSVPAHVVDAATFEVVAFIGKLSFVEFCTQVAFACVAGILVEFLLSFLAKRLAKRSERLGYSNGHLL